MKKLGIGLVVIVLLGIVVYTNQLAILMKVFPVINSYRNPVASNQEVVWSQGPETPVKPANQRPPNIIFILTDDMGFNDVSFTNGGAADGTLQTPHIDSIAKEGVIFTNGYASHATCAPSRASMLTGRYSTRFGFEYTPIQKIGLTIFELMNKEVEPPQRKMILHQEAVENYKPLDQMGMPNSEITIAEMLKEAGYYTAHIGKWHLGGVSPMRPIDQGFDDSLEMKGILYLPEDSPRVVNAKQDFDQIDKMVWASGRYAAGFNGGDDFEPRGYLTDYYTDEAVKVIEANKNRPFFLYLAHWGIHNPLQAKKEDYDALSHIKDHRLRVYAAMIRAVDRSVGRVMAALKDNGIDENTLIFFTSDNGGAGYLGLPDINKPYRGWKMTFLEGGTHVPFFARWPKAISPGTRFENPISHLDIFGTAAAAAGAAVPNDRRIDGVNLMPYINGDKKGDPHESIFWRTGHYQAVLNKGWKMMVSENPSKVWLFNLKEDPTEQHNIASRHPEKVAELRRLLNAHNAEQAESLWEAIGEMPNRPDKTAADPWVEGEEYFYWPG
ncbi:MAG: sulfatase-like hydrolase/transferase [Deltaproteobacteria bacterium]|jgi:arylsulfatase A-like enzyme|nr:sulfatase-like hydrolase/transferase [Deltaproteobacteria bacterium]MBT4641567.1 sulfatase-like hydrolase/transferase [Deltaproteobacteria bacterium]MBT6499375.1 sulfatase-like hydrolase/transferase [Deltaproteobacteria bacterium]MBT7710251.1 sulfatase-like hydrolase/transferase [Deltaproteobacteria bacterium]MBT7887607.1 sulfatase-like hydrolase/transferase [Deltaproteobacteria bacterium]